MPPFLRLSAPQNGITGPALPFFSTQPVQKPVLCLKSDDCHFRNRHLAVTDSAWRPTMSVFGNSSSKAAPVTPLSLRAKSVHMAVLLQKGDRAKMAGYVWGAGTSDFPQPKILGMTSFSLPNKKTLETRESSTQDESFWLATRDRYGRKGRQACVCFRESK